MKLNKIANNMTEITWTDKNDGCEISVLFSYNTPVAGYDDRGAFRTDQYFSKTTSAHINKYLGGKNIGIVRKQEFIEQLCSLSGVRYA